jgi:hypothetical protein
VHRGLGRELTAQKIDFRLASIDVQHPQCRDDICVDILIWLKTELWNTIVGLQ